MTAYYFAGRYSRNAELRGYRDRLVAALPGATVTSRWIDLHEDIVGGLQQSFEPEALNADPEGCWKFGVHDLNDLTDADVIVSFTETRGGGKGGRHVEHGYAIALGLRLVVVGPRENIFHCESETEVYSDFDAFLRGEATS